MKHMRIIHKHAVFNQSKQIINRLTPIAIGGYYAASFAVDTTERVTMMMLMIMIQLLIATAFAVGALLNK